MDPAKRIEVFNDRYPLIGPTFWMLSVQYYITQIVVSLAWAVPYSWLHNTISDLGNTACGLYGDSYVCSPLHGWMNASFIVLGASMIAGALLIYQEFKESEASLAGFVFMALAGFGTILVGLFPENTIGSLHLLGASLPFLLGNASLLIFSQALDMPRAMQVYTFLSGLLALFALPLFVTHHYLGLGAGGIERIVAYPQSIWLIIFGLYMSRDHFSRA